jgi:hypothetical protein
MNVLRGSDHFRLRYDRYFIPQRVIGIDLPSAIDVSLRKFQQAVRLLPVVSR